MKNTLKRILLLLPVISVLLVALAVPVFADYSPETGWSDPDQIIDGAVVLTFPRIQPDYSVSYRVIDFYGYELIPDFNSVDLSKYPTGGVLLPDDYEWYYTVSSESLTGTIIAKGLWLTSDGLFTNASLTDGLWDDVEFKAELVQAVYFGSYPPPATEEGLQFFSSFDFEVLQYVDSSYFTSIRSVWTEIMTWITSALNTVMGAFYVDGSLTLLGTLAVIGVSVGIGFLLIRLIQRFLHLRG